MSRKFKTYYVSSISGDDCNNGEAPETAFGSLDRINNLELNPGDRVLLERGSVFENQYLHIKGRGTRSDRIEIGAYGEGAMPCIHSNGTGIWYQDYGAPLDSPSHVYKGEVSSALLLYDVEYILVHDLIITNSSPYTTMEEYAAPHKMDRTGIAVVAKNRGTLHDITIRDVWVHDVTGNVYNKHMNNGGIYMTALTPDNEEKTGVARYDGITVENCTVWRVSRWGIAVGYTYQHQKFSGAELDEETFRKYGHENIIIRNCYVSQAGGDAITPMYSLEPLTEHNIADSCAKEMNDSVYRYPEDRMGKVAAAIWPWKCKNARFCYNEVTDTRLNQDGMAYDADSGDGTLYEYNYSRSNEGGCIMFCMEEAVHNIFRKNISYDDLGGLISPACNPDALVTENEFHMRREVPLIRESMQDGTVTLKNNKIIILNGE